MNPKQQAFPRELEQAFPGKRIVAYWAKQTDPDDAVEVDVLRVLGVPGDLLVAVDRWAYDRAHDQFGFDWDFSIDVRSEQDIRPGSPYAQAYFLEMLRRSLSTLQLGDQGELVHCYPPLSEAGFVGRFSSTDSHGSFGARTMVHRSSDTSDIVSVARFICPGASIKVSGGNVLVDLVDELPISPSAMYAANTHYSLAA